MAWYLIVILTSVGLLNIWATWLSVVEHQPWWKTALMVPFGFVFIVLFFLRET